MDFEELRKDVVGTMQVRQLTPTTSGFVFQTEPLYTDYEGVLYDLGAMTVDINLKNSIVRVSSDTTPEGESPHPHADPYGVLDMGYHGIVLWECISSGEYRSAVQLLLDILTNITDDITYRSIKEWPKIEPNPDGLKMLRVIQALANVTVQVQPAAVSQEEWEAMSRYEKSQWWLNWAMERS